MHWSVGICVWAKSLLEASPSRLVAPGRPGFRSTVLWWTGGELCVWQLFILFPGILANQEDWQEIKSTVGLGRQEQGGGEDMYSEQTGTSQLIYRSLTLLLLLVGKFISGFSSAPIAVWNHFDQIVWIICVLLKWGNSIMFPVPLFSSHHPTILGETPFSVSSTVLNRLEHAAQFNGMRWL